MKTTEKILQEEVLQLRDIAESARKRLETAPKGRLRIAKKQNQIEYYYKEPEEEGEVGRDDGKKVKENKNGRYMRNSYRKALIAPPVLSDEEFVRQWQAKEYKGKPFEDDENIILTERGERVRSKSEKIIADKLYALGIPYRYEYPLVLSGGVKVYPDFTILRMTTREEVYLEHFGMMDDLEYVETALYKLSSYEKNGIYLGVDLFVTYETGKRTLNTKGLDGLMRKLFCIE